MTWLGRWLGPGSLSGILALAGCGPPFTTATGGTGGTGGAGGQVTTGTSSGMTTTTTTTTTSCSSCGSGTVCVQGMCVACSTLADFSFGTAQPIAMANAPASATFPRLDKSMSSLFFVDASNQIELATMGSSEGTWAVPTVLPSPYNAMPQTIQEGPLPWTDGMNLAGIVDGTAVNLSKPILLFGSQRSGNQMLYAANLEMPPPGSASPLKMPPLGSGDRSIAVAFNATPPRAFWLRDGHLFTVTTGLGAALGATLLTFAFDGGCMADPSGAINDPWVHPDGKLLLFSAPAFTGSSCALATGTQARLFSVELDSTTGKPTGPATQIFGGDTTDDDRTPSLSTDGCLLLFSRSGTLTEAPRQ